MSGNGRAPKDKKKKKKIIVSARQLKRKSEAETIARLEEQTSDPAVILANPGLTRFSELPISSLTLQGLTKASFMEMTDIQKGALPYSLCGRDVLGAAKTGSGKTLAYLIPILEKLYKAKWNAMDGLGALVISPTRELAMQIFEVLRKIGRFHFFSAGLLIGGKDLVQEQERIGRMNILVCTPGRLLQHMDETPEFNADNLQILVLDEADRILDSGFQTTVNAIIANLPKSRQTLLFSATQTKSVRDLARLSLKDPEYVAVHEAAETATPKTLTQKYMVVELPQKLDVLFSFIKTHLKQKIIVFLSSCKQVRFVYETFCKLHPGVPLMCLHGKQKQQKRMLIFEEFCRKNFVCLFATDIAARGLDFPSVDWVVQVDCPEDSATYIHRVGRTARYDASGNALLMLLPSEEEGMVATLQQRKVPIEKITANPSRLKSIRQQMVMFCSKDPEIKYLAQKAFISYMRSVHLQSNKSIFKLSELPAEDFAESLGLPGAPKIKLVKKSEAKNAARPSKKVAAVDDFEDEAHDRVRGDSDVDGDDDEAGDDGEEEEKGNKASKPVTKVDRMFNAKNKTVLSGHYDKLRADDNFGEDDEENFFGLVRADHDVEAEAHGPVEKPKKVTKKELVKLRNKELIEKGAQRKIEFDEDGNPKASLLETLEEFEATRPITERQVEHLAEQTAYMQNVDVDDKEIAKQKRREKRLKKKLREKAEMMMDGDGEVGVQLAGGSDYDEDEDNDADDFSGDDDDDSGSYGGGHGRDDDDDDDGDDDDDDDGDEIADIDMDEDAPVVVASGSSGKKRSVAVDAQMAGRAGASKRRKFAETLRDTRDVEFLAKQLLKGGDKR